MLRASFAAGCGRGEGALDDRGCDSRTGESKCFRVWDSEILGSGLRAEAGKLNKYAPTHFQKNMHRNPVPRRYNNVTGYCSTYFWGPGIVSPV